MKDKELEKRILKLTDMLERLNDACGDTPVRHKISEHVVSIRKLTKGPTTPGYQ